MLPTARRGYSSTSASGENQGSSPLGLHGDRVLGVMHIEQHLNWGLWASDCATAQGA